MCSLRVGSLARTFAAATAVCTVGAGSFSSLLRSNAHAKDFAAHSWLGCCCLKILTVDLAYLTLPLDSGNQK